MKIPFRVLARFPANFTYIHTAAQAFYSNIRTPRPEAFRLSIQSYHKGKKEHEALRPSCFCGQEGL